MLIRIAVTFGWISLVTGHLAVAQDRGKSAVDDTAEQGWTRDGQDWPSFLGPDRNSHSSERGLRFDWTERTPTVVWSHRFGEGYGIGSVADGRYFHFDRQGEMARLTVLNAESGKPLWQFSYPTDYEDIYGFDGGPRTSPVIDENRVYIYGAEGLLHCLDVSTGNVMWKLDTFERFGVIQNFFGVGSTPLICDDLLVTMVGGSPPESANVRLGRLDEVKPNGNAVVGIDKMTGDIRYETIDDLASYSSIVQARIDGKNWCLAFCRSGLYGFAPASGEIGFEFPWRARKFESVNASTPVVFDSGVLITESYGLGSVFLKFENGEPEPVWSDGRLRDAALACHWATPVVVGKHVFASSGQHRGTAELRCVRMDDGTVMWSEPGLSRASLTAVDGHMICLTESGRLLAFAPDPDKFSITGEFPADQLGLVGPCWAAPVISHGYLYVRGKSRVVCLDIRE